MPAIAIDCHVPAKGILRMLCSVLCSASILTTCPFSVSDSYTPRPLNLGEEPGGRCSYEWWAVEVAITPTAAVLFLVYLLPSCLLITPALDIPVHDPSRV